MSSPKSSFTFDEIEQSFLDALKRLENGEPKNKKLKAQIKKGRLKINISNVALEAGRSRTLIGVKNCGYPKVREAIELAKGGRRSIPSTYTQLITNLRADLAQAKVEINMLQSTINNHFLSRKAAEQKSEAQAQINSRLRKELNELSKVAFLAQNTEITAPRLVLIRGLPGSGKTSRAKVYKKKDYEHFEADMFFEFEGQYLFDSDKLSEAHEWCLQRTRDALAKGAHVVVSNVFASVEEIKPYTKLGFEYEIIEAKGKGTSIHDIPPASLQSMKAAWMSTETVIEFLKPKAKVATLKKTRGKKVD